MHSTYPATTHAPADTAGSGAGPAQPGPARGSLDQNTHKWFEIEPPKSVPTYTIQAKRSGSSFDPLGCRAVDVNRADDVVAAFSALQGRCLFITLTIDRAQFTHPGVAYDLVKHRVRKVMKRLAKHLAIDMDRLYYICCIEPQTKTGDGWIHWHILVHAPGHESIKGIKRVVAKAWRIKEPRVDHDTGEYLGSMYLPVGMVDVQRAGSVTGTATYVAKYIVKRWPAVPEWMGESFVRHRKFRASEAFYNLLEQIHRHTPQTRASTTPTRATPHRRRTLFERMARSGATVDVFRQDGDRKQYVTTLAVPITGAVQLSDDPAKRLRCTQKGNLHRLRFETDDEGFQLLRAHAARHHRDVDEYKRRRHRDVRAAWDICQQLREMHEPPE